MYKIPKYDLGDNVINYQCRDYAISNKLDFDITNKEGVSLWISRFKAFLDSKGFQIFNRFNSLESLEELYNKTEDMRYFLPSQVSKNCIGLVLAKLVDCSKYDELVLKYRNSINHVIEFETKKSENVVYLLDLYSKEELLRL